jgi:hypothetical protein
MRYKNILVYSDYSGAQRKPLSCLGLTVAGRTDYSGAQRKSIRDKEMRPSRFFLRRERVCALRAR